MLALNFFFVFSNFSTQTCFILFFNVISYFVHKLYNVILELIYIKAYFNSPVLFSLSHWHAMYCMFTV